MTSLLKQTVTHSAIIVVAALCLFVPFLGSVHLFDWDEANFAEASREMLVTGNYLQVTINYEPFWEKPPLFFWLQALSMKVFGVNEFGARFVNAATGVVTLLIVYRIGTLLSGAMLGAFWALAFAGSFLPHLFFKSGIIDPVFNLCIFAAVYWLFRATEPAEKPRMSLYGLAGIMIGLATLTKGPVAILILVICGGSFWIASRNLRLWSIPGIAVMTVTALVTTFTFYGIETLRHGTWFMEEFIRYQIRLLRTGDAGHGQPIYFHAVVLLFGCFPASFFALRYILKPGKAVVDRTRRFSLWMITLFWVVLILFSLVKTKTVLYSSLAYYPITFLAALHLTQICRERARWNRTLTISVSLFSILVGTVIAAFPVLLMNARLIIPLIDDTFARACLERPVDWSGLEPLIGIGYLATCVAGIVLLAQKRYRTGFSSLFGGSALMLWLFMVVVAPKIEAYAQKGAIDFYKRFAGESAAYMKPLFKSYAYLFYARVPPDMPQQSFNRDWLLAGPIDKPAYFVARIDKAQGYRTKYGLTEVERDYGYVFLRRDPVELSPPDEDQSTP